MILAGGKSSRMGRNKAELLLDGKTFLQWQVDKLRDMGIGDILISGPMEPLPGTRAIPDIFPDRGPLGGLHACLAAAENTCCLVITVDVPLIPGETLSALLTAHSEGEEDVTLLSVDEGIEPLLAVYDKDLSGTIAELICDRSRPVRDLLKEVKTCVVPYSGPAEAILNCNTAEEYEKLCKYQHDQLC